MRRWAFTLGDGSRGRLRAEEERVGFLWPLWWGKEAAQEWPRVEQGCTDAEA